MKSIKSNVINRYNYKKGQDNINSDVNVRPKNKNNPSPSKSTTCLASPFCEQEAQQSGSTGTSISNINHINNNKFTNLKSSLSCFMLNRQDYYDEIETYRPRSPKGFNKSYYNHRNNQLNSENSSYSESEHNYCTTDDNNAEIVGGVFYEDESGIN